MAASDGVVYAAVVNLPGHVKAAADLDKPVLPVDFTEGTGTIVALDVGTGEIKEQELDQMPFGAMTVSNDLVFDDVRRHVARLLHRGRSESGRATWAPARTRRWPSQVTRS